MKSIYFTIILVNLISSCLRAQTDSLLNAYKKVYKGLYEARTANPDSVFAIDLRSLKLKKLPSELKNYKNLEVIFYGSHTVDQMAGYMNRKEKRREKRKLKRLTISLYQPSSFRPNSFLDMPSWLTELKHLKYFEFDGAKYNYQAVVDLKLAFPNLKLYPSWPYIKGQIEIHNERYPKKKISLPN